MASGTERIDSGSGQNARLSGILMKLAEITSYLQESTETALPVWRWLARLWLFDNRYDYPGGALWGGGLPALPMEWGRSARGRQPGRPGGLPLDSARETRTGTDDNGLWDGRAASLGSVSSLQAELRALA